MFPCRLTLRLFWVNIQGEPGAFSSSFLPGGWVMLSDGTERGRCLCRGCHCRHPTSFHWGACLPICLPLLTQGGSHRLLLPVWIYWCEQQHCGLQWIVKDELFWKVTFWKTNCASPKRVWGSIRWLTRFQDPAWCCCFGGKFQKREGTCAEPEYSLQLELKGFGYLNCWITHKHAGGYKGTVQIQIHTLIHTVVWTKDVSLCSLLTFEIAPHSICEYTYPHTGTKQVVLAMVTLPPPAKT